MKVKKRLMIDLAGAMILGVFGTSGVPVMAAASEPDFMVSIPADLMITHTGWNEAGKLSMSVKNPGTIFLATVEPEDDAGYRYLVNRNDESKKIPYRLSGKDEEYYSSYSFGNEQPFTFYNHNETFSLFIGAEIENDYSDMPPGEYKDTVTFTAYLGPLPSA